MTREQATTLTYQLLKQNNLDDWKVRLTSNLSYLGKCVYKDKCIYLNNHHIDTNPDKEIDHTIRHEIAHALCPYNGHDEIWQKKILELGAKHSNPCGGPLSSEAIDAIRSGHVVEAEYTEEIVRKVTHRITRLQDTCPTCNKIAKEKSHKVTSTHKIILLECNHFIFKELPKQTPFESLTSSDGKKLYQFQIEGARFIEQAFGRAGIFDEMGLGKTVQTLAYLKFHPEAFPVLFIVKAGIKYQWLSEIFRWLGDDYFAQIIGTSKEKLIKGFKCYIASYSILRRYDINQFKEIGIKTVIIDECQAIKNPNASQTACVRNIVREAKGFIPLSGTPWKNRGSEYFPVLNMLDPVRFSSYKNFINRWVDYYSSGNKYVEGGIRDIKQFKEYTKDICIRRQRDEVDVEFPSLNRVKFHTELDETTRAVYDEEVSDFIKWWNQVIISGEEQLEEVNAIARLQRMRHMLGLSKIPATVDLIEEFFENTDRKLAVFVHHKDVGEIISKKSHELNLKVPILRLTSDMNAIERYSCQETFNKTQKCLLIGSTLASGEGLNLQTCSDGILHERQWNPANEEQVEGRFVRIGSIANKVNMTYVHAENSLDTKLDTIIEQKRVQFHNSMNKGEMLQWNESSIIGDLIASLVRR